MRKKKRPAPPSFEKFTTDFPKALQNYSAEPLISFILKDQTRGKRCAALLWPCVNGSSASLVEISEKWIAKRDSQLTTAIRGKDAEIEINMNITSNPLRAKSLSRNRRDLLEQQGKLLALPSKKMGRDHNWSLVLHTKESLESFLCQSLPYATLAALLNTAYVESGQALRSYTSAAISSALKRLSRYLA